MKTSKIVQKIMFDYEDLPKDELLNLCQKLSWKVVRWLGMNHPDNRTRKIFYRVTGVEVGKETVINRNFLVSDNYKPLLKIGERVSIAPNVTVICATDPNNSLLSQNPNVSVLSGEKQVVIEDDAWIGTNVAILPGIIIGKRSIIGAGSIVTKDVPSDSIVVGNPAEVIRRLK